MGADFDFTALTQVDDNVREEILEELPPETVAEGVRELDSDDAVAILPDQLPHLQPLVEWQRFEHAGDIGGMHLVELALQLGDVLAMRQVLDQFMARHLLAMHERLDDLLPVQELGYLFQVVLEP
jgi:hypothetical protein